MDYCNIVPIIYNLKLKKNMLHVYISGSVDQKLLEAEISQYSINNN